jgi:hypothetical protein
MNERIKELWETSDEIKVCYPEQGSPVSVSAETLEKFAELIINDCLACADRMADSLEKDEAYKEALGASWAALAIARRYGL